MEQFCRLSRIVPYRACDWDLLADPIGLRAWLEVFAEHTASLLEHARTSDHPPAQSVLSAYERCFLDLLESVRRSPADFAPLTIYRLCQLRAHEMRRHGLGDPYDRVKRQENLAALRHLPGVLAALDQVADDRIVEVLLRGLLAGNKFDLGARDTVQQHAREGIDFFKTLDELAVRPWFVDDCDRITARLARRECRYRKAIFFVDNAGADIVLGALPFARYLASAGCGVVLAANDEPSLNDVTVTELQELLAAAADCDARLAEQLRSGRITTVGTGCDCPLIDLSTVTRECNAAATDCDLVVIEGMGRAVETNYSARFDCDALRLAMIKNRSLARYLGCRMYDLIARFTPGEG